MVLILLAIKILGIPIWLFIPLLALILLFLYWGSRPYTDQEIEDIGLRKDEQIMRREFLFTRNPPPDLLDEVERTKPLIDGRGGIIQVEIPFQYGPACAAYWLKYRQHQWSIVLYGNRNKVFVLMSGNKGKDNRDVEYYRNNEHLFSFRYRSRFDTVLVFHNHPMSVDPNVSNTDQQRAEQRSRLAMESDWNYIEFLCVRGNFKRFRSVLSSEYAAQRNYEEKYKKINSLGALAILKSRWIKA